MSTAHEPFYSDDGMPKERYRLYHVEKAKGGMALTMTAGSAVVSPDTPPMFWQISANEEARERDDMAKQEGWDRLILYIAGIAVVGVVLCLIGYNIEPPPPPAKGATESAFWREVSTGLGTALLIASALAWTVDKYFKLRLLRDAFEAVFGYVLPDYFREELNRLAREVFIATSADLVLEIKPIGGELVEITWSFDRDLKNITDRTQTFDFRIGLDDFGIPGQCSKLLRCTIRLPDQPDRVHSVMTEGPNSKPDRAGRLESNIERIKIPAHGKFSVYQEISEIHRVNGTAYWVGFQPCRNPTIEVKISPGLKLNYLVEFLHPNITAPELAPNKHSLSGTFLSYQPVIVRWWPEGFNAKEHADQVKAMQRADSSLVN